MWIIEQNGLVATPQDNELFIVARKRLSFAADVKFFFYHELAFATFPNGDVKTFAYELDLLLGKTKLSGKYHYDENKDPKLEDLLEFKKWALEHEQYVPLISQAQSQLASSQVQLGDREVSKSLVDLLDKWFWLKHDPSFIESRKLFRAFVQVALEQLLKYGPLTTLLSDQQITEILVNGPNDIRIESCGQLQKSLLSFANAQHLAAVTERLLSGTGRRLTWLTPSVDCQLPDGSRLHVVAPPVSKVGICLSIRKFKKQIHNLDALVKLGAIDDSLCSFLKEQVKLKKNIIISGGTSTGKTTFLNALSSEICPTERVITVEDSAELSLSHPHVIGLESRPANSEGLGDVSIRELVKNALRMRPDRILVGECRAGETLDMLQAMNTGHDGSMTTVHANNALGALMRLETLSLYANSGLPSRGVRQQIGTAVHLVIQLKRQQGSRRLTEIAEVFPSSDQEMGYELRSIVTFCPEKKNWSWSS